MDSGTFRRTHYSAQIVRILQSVQNYDKRVLSPFSGSVKDIIHSAVSVIRNYRDDSLCAPPEAVLSIRFFSL